MDQNTDQLLAAVKSGDRQRVTELLRGSPELRDAANESGTSAVLLSAYHGHPEIASEFVAAGRQLTIFEAAAAGELDRVRELSDQANATAPDGFQPLGLACFFGQEKVAQFLIETGADVHLASNNAMRIQPIHAAAAKKSARLVEALLRRGADPDARQQLGYTPLHSAAQNGDSATVDVLLGAGADRHLRSDDGNCAADLAEKAGHTNLAARLR